MSLICILGRQPALGLAELESRFGAEAINIIQPDIVRLETDQPYEIFDQLGSIQKVAKVWDIADSTDWKKISSHLVKELPGDWTASIGGKLKLGLSVYGISASPAQINATALSLKKELRRTSTLSVRIIPNTEPALNSAQVIHNKLIGLKGLELLVIKDGHRTVIAQTNWVQDIDAYRRRDQERPARDARIGMLPPKLAQIIISLAVGPGVTFSRNAGTSLKVNQTAADPVLLDPFCGTGVVLQEALIQGLAALGADLEPRMIEYSQKNLEWLARHLTQSPDYKLQAGDATSAGWPQPFDVIATETYLGRPFTSPPDQATLQQTVHDCNVIHKKFLQNVAAQTTKGFRMCIAVPAWHTRAGFKRLPVLDHLRELGYNRVSFVHAETSDLIYHRENQITARELVVLIRK